MPGADACVATQELAKRVEARLGRSVFTSAAVADVSVEGHVEPASPRAPHAGFRAVLTLRDARGALLGTRELARADASCDSLTEPLVLVIAVMIDPDTPLGAKPLPASETPSAAAPPTVVVVEKPVYVVAAPPVLPRPPPTWRIDVGAAAATTLGLLPAPNLGVAASGLLEPPGLFPLEGFGAAWFDDPKHDGATSAAFSLGYVGGGPCPLHYRGDRVRLYGCAIGELGAFAHTSGSASSTDVYLAGGLEGRLSVRIAGPFAVRLGVNGVVPLFRPTTTAGMTELFRPSVVGGAADLGFGVLLP